MSNTRRGRNEGMIRYRESNKLYEGRYTIGTRPDGKTLYKSIYGKKRKDVVERMNNALSLIGKGLYSDPSSKPLIVWCQEWFSLYVEPTVKLSTKEKYKSSIKRLSNHQISNTKLKNLNMESIQKYYNSLALIYSYSTIQIMNILINGALNKAEANGLINKNPARHTKLPKNDFIKPKAIQALNQEQYKIFMNELQKKSNYYMLALFIVNTGLRPGEAIALSRSDLNLSTKKVKVYKTYLSNQNLLQNSPKTESSNRILPIPNNLVGLMKEYNLKQSNKYTNSPLFQTTNGNRINSRNVIRQFKVIGKVIGCPWVNIHTLRHTYASNLFKEGIDIKIISNLLGHKDVSTTYNIYVHFTDNIVADSVQVLNKLIPKSVDINSKKEIPELLSIRK